MQTHVCLTSVSSRDRKPDRNSVRPTSVNPPLWSHEASTGSIDVTLLPADARKKKQNVKDYKAGGLHRLKRVKNGIEANISVC